MRTFSGILAFATVLLAPQILQAQGTIYLSNLGQASAGSLAVGSNSWQAALFLTGTNAGGYVLNSVQLGMTDASGNPSGFLVMLYTGTGVAGINPGSSLGDLNGSLNPTPGGIFTYTPTLNLTLSPHTYYFIVLTAGTAVANGAYDWSYAEAISYNPSGGWLSEGSVLTSSNGSTWPQFTPVSSQFAINVTDVPEPGVMSLFGLSSLFFLWHHRKSKMV